MAHSPFMPPISLYFLYLCMAFCSISSSPFPPNAETAGSKETNQPTDHQRQPAGPIFPALKEMSDILDIAEGEEEFNPEDLDEKEVLGDDEEAGHNKM
ncbi:hypothetical protein Ddc_01784 [Ditylenchus destructor]|nr:hypothetical protein Ddc_01784 [Ditylenchus destructor]